MGFASLDAALAGLRVSQQQLSTISNNVANVGTPGFSRKILPQSTLAIDGQTVGVRGDIVIRNVDSTLTRDLWTQVSAVGQLDIKQTFLNRVEEFHGPPDQELSVAAEISRLQETFIQLADSPDDNFLLASAVDQAVDTADKLNDLATLIDDLRIDAQTEMASTVTEVNNLLEQIRLLNFNFKNALNTSRSTATIADQRDQAVKELAELIDITFFSRGDGTLVVQTNRGQELVSDFTRPLTFEPASIGSTSHYPVDVAGVFLGDPNTEFSAVDLTVLNPGGRLGGLIELRDDILPKQTSQIDELAHKLALRFEAQGLTLFTGPTGTVPDDTPPDPTPDPTPATLIPPQPIDPDVPTQAVEYIGFARAIQVNPAILADNTLIQRGTISTDLSLPIASNDTVNRILNYTFTDLSHQEALGTVDIRASRDLSGGGGTMQEWLGIFSENTLQGQLNLGSFTDPDGAGPLTSVDQLINTINGTNGVLVDPTSDFNIRFEENRWPVIPGIDNYMDITISLGDLTSPAAAPLGTEDVATRFANAINDAITTRLAALPPVNPLLGTAGLTPAASISPNGELVLQSRGSIIIDGTGDSTPNAPSGAFPALANPIGAFGLNLIGLPEIKDAGQAPVDPYFDIRIGNDDFTRITIEPGEDENDLMEKLDLVVPNLPTDTEGVPGLAVDRTSITDIDPLGFGGALNLRPGDDYDNPRFGGDMQIISGPFSVTAGLAAINNAANDPVIIPPVTGPEVSSGTGTLEDGISLVSALFGSFTPAAPPTTPNALNNEAVTNQAWGSITDARLIPTPPATTPEAPTVPFRSELLGPGADINSEVDGSTTLLDFGQRIVNQHAQELILIDNNFSDEDSLRQALETRLTNESGVNLDEELAHMVVVQTAFAASARVLSTVDELFEEFLRIL